jgi:hypothetical protein
MALLAVDSCLAGDVAAAGVGAGVGASDDGGAQMAAATEGFQVLAEGLCVVVVAVVHFSVVRLLCE